MRDKILNITFITIFYIFVFQTVIQRVIPIFSYLDELIGLIYFPIVIAKMIKYEKVRKNYISLAIFLLLVCMIVSGLYSNVKYRYQEWRYVLGDVIVNIKFFGVYWLSASLFDLNFINKNKKKIVMNVNILVYLLFGLTVLNFVFPVFEAHDYRFGMAANQLFYGHPSDLSAVSFFLLALLLMCGKDWKCKEFIMLLVIILSTLRLRSIGTLIAVLLVMTIVRCTNKKLSMMQLLVIGVICSMAAADQVIFYYGNDNTARSALMGTSIQIVKDYFPLGTGFGTFASHFSSVNYSPVYFLYGISGIYGIAEGYSNFISDTFWPMIAGQFGFLGLVNYLLILCLIFYRIQKQYRWSRSLYLAKLSCFLYLIIASTSASAFVHPTSMMLAFLLGINVSRNSVWSGKQYLRVKDE